MNERQAERGGLMRALAGHWRARRRRRMAVPRPLVASRDLPSPSAVAALPRSPEPMPEEALIFAQEAATRRRADPPAFVPEPASASPALASIATGADLRALLERFERATRRRQALDHAAQARGRLVERLAAGRAMPGERPALRLVVGEGAARRQAQDEQRIERAMDEALASALVTLRRLNALARD